MKFCTYTKIYRVRIVETNVPPTQKLVHLSAIAKNHMAIHKAR
jgi:hypothetical protein